MGSRQSPHTKPETATNQRDNDRLAQALRDNLHRRKAQARARSSRVTQDVGVRQDSNDQKKQ